MASSDTLTVDQYIYIIVVTTDGPEILQFNYGIHGYSDKGGDQ